MYGESRFRSCRKNAGPPQHREFRRLVTNIVDEDSKFHHIPDYSVTLDDSDMVTFRSRWKRLPIHTALLVPADSASRPSLEVYHDAKLVAPGWDVTTSKASGGTGSQKPPETRKPHFLAFARSGTNGADTLAESLGTRWTTAGSRVT